VVPLLSTVEDLSFLLDTIPWPRPVEPNIVRRVGCPRIDFVEECFTPVERLVKRVVRRTVNELDEIYVPRLNEAGFYCTLNEGANRFKVSKNVREDNGCRHKLSMQWGAGEVERIRFA